MSGPDEPAGGAGPGPRRQPVRRLDRRTTPPDRPIDAVAAGGRMGPPPPRGRVERLALEAAVDQERAERRAERRVSLLFLLSAAGTVTFVVSYGITHVSGDNLRHLQVMTVLWGLALFVALFGLGAGAIVWAKQLMPHEVLVQHREPHMSSEAEEAAAEDTFLAGVESSRIARRSLLRRTLLLANGLLLVPAIVALRDLGPAPKTKLRQTPWRKGVRLVDLATGAPVRLGDLEFGGVRSVMPEGFDKLTVEDTATSSTLLIRLRPGEDHPLPGRGNWSADSHVAYSKICTHAGCPVGLYEQQTHHLFCPCHQSTFLVTEGCRVVFGPAARSLPQLPIAVDGQGYFIAQGPYDQPVGPSFWERG